MEGLSFVLVIILGIVIVVSQVPGIVRELKGKNNTKRSTKD